MSVTGETGRCEAPGPCGRKQPGGSGMGEWAVSVGLFAAWLLNDIEELVTMRADSAATFASAPQWLPIPADLRRQGVSQAHVELAITLMGAFIAAAAADGVRTGARSRFFRTVFTGFGAHGIGHLVTAARARRWTTGSRTAVVVVLPYWWWGHEHLRRAGISSTEGVSWPLVSAAPVLMAGVHGLAWAVRRAVGVEHPFTDPA